MKLPVPRWTLLVLLGVVFVAMGVAFIMIGLADDETTVLVVSALPLVIGLKMLWDANQVRKEARMSNVPPTTALPGGVPWSEVEQRLRARFADDKYTVTAQGSSIKIDANLANAAFFTLGGAKKVAQVRGIEIIATKPGQAITRDYMKSAKFFAGKGDEAGRWEFAGDAEFFSGGSWNYSRSIEFGADRDGIGKKVDIEYSTSELKQPVKEILQETGWYTSFYRSLGAEQRGGLWVGIISALATAVLGILALLGKLD